MDRGSDLCASEVIEALGSGRCMTSNRKRIIILGTGGTIAGFTGGGREDDDSKRVVWSIDDLLACVSGVQGVADLCVEQVANVDSKDMGFAIWQRLAVRVREWLERDDIDACVVTHGTDTMEETAYFLSLVHGHRKPVVITGAMRLPDSLSPDGPANLYDAVRVAADPQSVGCGVLCVMHGRIHSARDVTKVQAASIDAFTSGEDGPVGFITPEGVRIVRQVEKETGVPFMIPAPSREWPRVEIVLSHTGADGAVVLGLLHELLRSVRPLRGLVVAGTGSGRVHNEMETALKTARAHGLRVEVVSRISAGSCGKFARLNPVKARVRMMLELMSSGGCFIPEIDSI